MNFFKTFKNSIFSINSYKELVNEKFGKSLLYLTILSLIFSTFIAIKTGLSLNKGYNYLVTLYNNDFPEFQFNYGTLNVDVNMPYILQDEETGEILFIDTRDGADKTIVEEYNSGLFIFKEQAIAIKNNGRTISTYNYNEFNSSIGYNYFTKEDLKDLFPMFEKIKAYLYVIIFIVYFIYKAISLLFLSIFYAIVSFVISKIMKVDLIFDKLWTICVYALTLPTILGILASGFALPIPYFKFLKFIITIVYIVLALKLLKVKDNEDNNNQLIYSQN